MQRQRAEAGGLWAFLTIALGQFVSLVGSTLSGFALGVWVYERNGSVTQFALISLCAVLPGLLISPIAGALVDRWERRWAMILSDAGSVLCTLAIALLLAAGWLEVWQIYVTTVLSSAVRAFQQPAFSAAIPQLVPKRHLGRANGMVMAGFAIAQILSPALAGVLVMTIRLEGVILIDMITFFVAIGTLLAVPIPRPAPTDEGAAGQGSLLREALFGWLYIRARPGMLVLLMFFTVSNFLESLIGSLVTPLVLAFASPAALGMLVSVGGIGMLAGSLLMGFWGGPRRRINGVFVFMLAGGLCMALAGVRPSVVLLAVAAFGFFFCQPIIGGCAQAIVQSKVPLDLQGRFFATSGMICLAAVPLAFLFSGPLADRVFEPLLAADGALASSVGRVIGAGPGRGIGLMFVIAGVFTALLVLASMAYPRLRFVEDELPDAIPDQPPALDPQPGVGVSYAVRDT